MEIDKYLINRNDTIEYALQKIDNNHMGIIFIENNEKIIGCCTDGDIRRILLIEKNLQVKIIKCINKNFVYLFENRATKENILKLLDSRIRVIPILDQNYKIVSVV